MGGGGGREGGAVALGFCRIKKKVCNLYRGTEVDICDMGISGDMVFSFFSNLERKFNVHKVGPKTFQCG